MDRQWTTGDCWLWCQRTGVQVLWLGPVQWDGQHAALHACEACIHHVENKLRAWHLRGGASGHGPLPGRRRWADADCWRCSRLVPTLWVGVVERATATAPLHLCEPCIQELEAKVQNALLGDYMSA
ncbi:hypothetical protein [Streptomyces sp. NPDC048644]|uniref:hypothetical protein n=1 Tax=Streptomyces sp. NPDC048644 TaxID=3365582 RepID=UPI003724C486